MSFLHTQFLFQRVQLKNRLHTLQYLMLYVFLCFLGLSSHERMEIQEKNGVYGAETHSSVKIWENFVEIKQNI